VSADTVVPGAGNPQALNRYAYVLGNPLKYTDPSGHSVDCSIGDPYCRAGKLDVGRRAVDLADRLGKKRTQYQQLNAQQKSILAEGGIGSTGAYNEHVGGGVSTADAAHDPLTYGLAAFGAYKLAGPVYQAAQYGASYCMAAFGWCATVLGGGTATTAGVSDKVYREYQALRLQGYTASEAYALIKQFNSGANPSGQFAFHFTTARGAEGIATTGEVWATGARGLAGPGVYMGTVPDPGLLKYVPVVGYGVPFANYRISVYISPEIASAIRIPLLPLQTAIYGTGQNLILSGP
jgi:hypothetical protein